MKITILDAKAGKCNGGKGFFILNFGTGPRWIPARVTEKTGPVSYQCELQDGRIIRRHVDNLRQRQHTLDRVIRKGHTNTRKKDSIEGREDEKFTKGRG